MNAPLPGLGNPLLEAWTLPHGLPPFAAIRPEHFAPAFEVAMREHRAELDAIAAQAEAPSFDNTLARWDASGRLLSRIELAFHNLCASETSPALQAVQRTMAGPLAAHANAQYMHAGLFRRIDAVHAARDTLALTPQQRRLVERVHSDFVRAGARLAPSAQLRYAAIMERLATLTTQFGQNVLADEMGYTLRLAHEGDLAGLPAFVRDAAQEAARERGLPGHVITLSRSLIVPFLTFSDRRDLREAAWRAWTSRGEHAGASDNRPLVREILRLRAEQASLHGFACYADYALANTMAREQGAVMRLLDDVWSRALPAVERERRQLLDAMAAAGVTHALEPWDWRYWAERVRQHTYAIDEASVKPYFTLERMVAAAFDCATRLFGVRFVERPDFVLYHPDVKAYEVLGADGAVTGVFLHDNYARPSKRSGAWMSNYREQTRNGGAVIPIVVNNNNFAKAGEGEPTLLSFDDVRTLFHEFGHGLHGLLSDVDYQRLSGTNVLGDFVELPSQLFEHWMSEPQVLEAHARHAHTGEVIPAALVARLKAARRFGQAYETVRYVASALTDMAVHALPADRLPEDPLAFEAQVLAGRGLPAGVGVNHRFTHFQHLFAGSGYAAGYYYYLWAEVLDADAFTAFEDAGDVFDAGIASRLLRHVYAAGDSVDPGSAYQAFRGRAPTLAPMLSKRGLVSDVAA
jgi:peptidyl-dipeptidase Dcp